MTSCTLTYLAVALPQVFKPSAPVSKIDDHGWTVRAEPVPEDEVDLLDTGRMLHVYHFQFEGEKKQVGRARVISCSLHHTQICTTSQ